MKKNYDCDHYDCVIIGAGAAGLMAAIQAGKRGKSVLIIEYSQQPAKKIRISGGGRCNFINIYQSDKAYLSGNVHFCKSALSRFTSDDFISMVQKHKINYHEKTLGQLFCDDSSQNIIQMLLKECEDTGVKLSLNTEINNIIHNRHYQINTSKGSVETNSLVIATGGLSIPKMGATDFGYKTAKQFGIQVTKLHAGLVPLTFQDTLLAFCKNLSGLSVDAIVSYKKVQFREGLLFTHRGLSGPSILQISSYWQGGNHITINLTPDIDMLSFLQSKKNSSKQDISNVLQTTLPKRLSQAILEELNLSGHIAEISNKNIQTLAKRITQWQITPSGTEGYRTAEVTVGGIDTSELSSKTMEAKKQPGLYFIGEVVDVTGHLGGFNFGWAWASGYACGQSIL